MTAAIAIIHSVIEFHGFIPIVCGRESVETVVTCSLCRKLIIGIIAISKVDRRRE